MSIAKRFAIVLLIALLAGCSGGSGGGSEGSATSTTATRSGEALTGRQLQSLIVNPSAPFEKLPDNVLQTGLMEVGNPASGKIGLPFTTERQVVRLGFQRGWETIFRAPDGAIVDIDVFEFETAKGPTTIVAQSLAHTEPGYRRRPISGVPGASLQIGRSPEGRVATATAFAHGRFLAVLLVAGPPKARDYAALISKLTRDQLAKLP